MRKIMLLSNSTVSGSSFLDWASDMLKEFLSNEKVKEILFIPYALQDLDKYTNTASKAFNKIGLNLTGIHTFESPLLAVEKAEAIFIGGGNTFRLLKLLYDKELIEPIRHRVLKDNIPYIGSSAGTNVATVTINTTNDMPIVYPPTFHALQLVNFNINPHYIDALPSSTHMGETREERIKQFHEESSKPVVGLREGSLLHVMGDSIRLRGHKPARVFIRGEEPKEYDIGSDLSFLLTA